jgi:hypothetical protein
VPHRGVLAVAAVHGHPAERHPGGDRLGQQLDGLLGLGSEAHLGRNPGVPAPLRVVGPASRQVQAVADERVTSRRGVGQHDRDLAVLQLS